MKTICLATIMVCFAMSLLYSQECTIEEVNLEFISQNGNICTYYVDLFYKTTGQDSNNGELTFTTSTMGVTILNGTEGPYDCFCNGMTYTIEFSAPCKSIVTFTAHYDQPGQGDVHNCTTPPIDVDLPVDLGVFKASFKHSVVHLEWETYSEVNNEGFYLQRSHNGQEFKDISFINGHGNSSQLLKYAFVDRDVVFRNQYYRLKQIDFDGQFWYSPIIRVTTHKTDPTYSLQYDQILFNEEIESAALFNVQGQILSQAFDVSSLIIPQNASELLFLVVDGQTFKFTNPMLY